MSTHTEEVRERPEAVAPTASLVRPNPGLLVFAVAAFLIMSAGALVALLPLRSETTGAEPFQSGSTPIGSISASDLRLSPGPSDGSEPDTSVFSAACPEIDLRAELDGVHETTPVTARLEDMTAEAPYDALPVYVEEDGLVTFTFPRLHSRWDPGLWRASVIVNGEEAAYTEFAVR